MSIYISPEEIALQLDVTPRTVRGWMAGGKIPGSFQTPGGEWRLTREKYDLWITDLQTAVSKLTEQD
jgi:excisionase family DNA binding protein